MASRPAPMATPAPGAAAAQQVCGKRKEPEPWTTEESYCLLLAESHYSSAAAGATVTEQLPPPQPPQAGTGTAAEMHEGGGRYSDVVDDKEREFAEWLATPLDERLAWLAAEEAKLGITSPPEVLELDPARFDDPDFSMLRAEIYKEGKRRFGNDGLVHYYD